MPLLGLIRHGETEWNALGKMQGRADVPLTDKTRETLLRLAPPQQLHDATWYTSPLSRAQETARLLGVKNAEPDRRLIETDWGEWQGKTLAELRDELGPQFLENEGKGRHFKPTNGESPADIMGRIQPFFDEISAKKGPIGAITHKGVIRAVLSLAYNWDMKSAAPVRLIWQTAHLFEIDPKGGVHPIEMNVPLSGKEGGR